MTPGLSAGLFIGTFKMQNLPLKRPVAFDGQTYASMPIDEPTLGAIEAYENAKADGKSDVSAMIELMAVDSGWPAGAVRKIRKTDLEAITEAYAPFLGGEAGNPGAPSQQT